MQKPTNMSEQMLPLFTFTPVREWLVGSAISTKTLMSHSSAGAKDTMTP
jgi:hypothetical protein